MKKSKKERLSERINKRFRILHFPLTGKFYPQYRGYWLLKQYGTGIIRTESMFDIADGFSTEDNAREYVELYKEQKLMQNINYINC